MCGIAAIFNYKGESSVDRAEMGRMLDHMKRRGPDGSGEWYGLNGAVGLGHRRLSIIDLSENGAQPMGLGEESRKQKAESGKTTPHPGPLLGRGGEGGGNRVGAVITFN